MAEKFLGEAGLGVLINHIKPYTIAMDTNWLLGDPIPLDVIDNAFKIYKNLWIYSPKSGDYFQVVDMVIHSNQLDFFRLHERTKGWIYSRAATVFEGEIFFAVTDQGVNIQEITAREVTDKFNS